MKRSRLPAVAADAALAALGGVSGFVRDFSGDFHWHLVLGDYTLRHGALMRSDVLSHTFSGRPQAIDYWLADLSLAATYRLLGYPGCYLLRGLLLAALLVLLARGARALGLGVWTAALLPVFVLAELFFRLYLRPETFTFPLLAGILVLLGRHEQGGNPRALWGTLPLVLLWANVHGSVLIAILVLGCYSAVSVARGLLARALDRPKLLQLLGLPLLAFLVSILNPEGLRQPLMFLYVTADDPTFAAGVEWQALSLESLSPLFPLMAGVVVVSSLVAARAVSLWRLLVVALLVAVSFSHGRFIKAALIGAVPLVAGNFVAIKARYRAELDTLRSRNLVRALQAVATLGLAVFLLGERRLTREVGLGLDPGIYPERACAFARDHALPKEMLNSFDFGSYLLFCLPERRTYIDQRAATLFTPEFSNEYYALPRHRELLESRVARYGVSFAFVGFDPMAQQLASDPSHWALVYFDDLAQLYVRASTPERADTPRFSWLHPYALAPLTLLRGAALSAAQDELRLQAARCPDCRQTLLLDAALHADDPSFEARLSRVAQEGATDTTFLLAVAAFRDKDFATAFALFRQARESSDETIAAELWMRRVQIQLGKKPLLLRDEQLLRAAVFRAEVEALRASATGAF